MSVVEVRLKKSLQFDTCWTFIFFSALFWTHVTAVSPGQPHLIGSPEPIIAAPGDDVILPCHSNPGWNATSGTVEWSRPDLKPDPSHRPRGVEYVFVYRFLREDRDMMMDSYIQRTSLSTDRLQYGDLSLTIRKVTLQDNGRFRCFTPNLESGAEVLLVVDPNFIRATTTEAPGFNQNLITLDPLDEDGPDRTGRGSRHHIVLFPVFLVFVSLILLVFFNKHLFSLKQKLCSYDSESAKPPIV